MIKDTLVKTPTGARAIADLKRGDLVYDEFGKPVKVRQVTPKGRKPVVDLVMSGKAWVTCSPEDKWLVKECCGPRQFIAEIRSVSNFKPENRLFINLEGCPFGTGFTVQVGRDTREEDTYDLDVDSETQLYLLDNGLIAHA